MKMKYLIPEIHVLDADDTQRFDVYNSTVGDISEQDPEGSDFDEQSGGFSLPVL